MKCYISKICKFFNDGYRKQCVKNGVHLPEIARLKSKDVKRFDWFSNIVSYNPRLRRTSSENLLGDSGLGPIQDFIETCKPPFDIRFACWCVQFPIMAYALHAILLLLVSGAAFVAVGGIFAASLHLFISLESAGKNTSSSTTNDFDYIPPHLNASSVRLDQNNSQQLPDVSVSSLNVSELVDIPEHKPADNLLLDISKISPAFFKLLGLHNPNNGSNPPPECRETPFLILHGIPIRNFLCRTENGIRADKFLQPDLNEANKESAVHAYGFVAEVVAIDIKASSCTSNALENLELLLSQPWNQLLILSVSVRNSSCLPQVLEVLANGLQAPNLQVLSINFLDATNTNHVESVTSVFDSLRPRTLLQLSLIKFVDTGDSGFFLDHHDQAKVAFQTERIVLKLGREASRDAFNPLFVSQLKDQSLVFMERSIKCVDLSIDFGITPQVAADATFEFAANDVHFCRAHYEISVTRFNETVVAPIFPGNIVHIRVHAQEKAAPRTQVTIDIGTSSLPLDLKYEFNDPDVNGIKNRWDFKQVCSKKYWFEPWGSDGSTSVIHCMNEPVPANSL